MTHSSSLAMQHYSIEAITRKYVKGYGFLSCARNLSKKYGIQLQKLKEMLLNNNS